MLKSILLIDDDSVTNFVNSKIIKKQNIFESVVVKNSGNAALKYLYETNIPTIILLDINMPVMNGFDFLDEYYKYGFNANETTVIMLTSSVLESDKAKALKYNRVHSFLTKPLTVEKVLELKLLLI